MDGASVKLRLREFIAVRTARSVKYMLRMIDPHASISYAQEGEDMILLRLFGKYSRGFYVDVGAHHPFRFSNTQALHMRGWKGINIDADPNAIAAFRRVRPRDINLSLGVMDSVGRSTLHVFSDPALNTFNVELANKREQLPAYRLLERREIEVDRLGAILARYLAKDATIDLLNVDVEGHDLDVLHGNDWERFRPRCVVVEARISALDEIVSDPIHRFLTKENYRLYAKTVNTLIYVGRAEVFA